MEAAVQRRFARSELGRIYRNDAQGNCRLSGGKSTGKNRTKSCQETTQAIQPSDKTESDLKTKTTQFLKKNCDSAIRPAYRFSFSFLWGNFLVNGFEASIAVFISPIQGMTVTQLKLKISGCGIKYEFFIA